MKEKTEKRNIKKLPVKAKKKSTKLQNSSDTTSKKGDAASQSSSRDQGGTSATSEAKKLGVVKPLGHYSTRERKRGGERK